MSENLSAGELKQLVRDVFEPRDDDRGLAILVDLPDDRLPDHDVWRARRNMAYEWAQILDSARKDLGLKDVGLGVYPNVGANNADLPEKIAILPASGAMPSQAQELKASDLVPLAELHQRFTMAIALTELSATAPLKLMGRETGLRAVTMPGFTPEMVPALRLDYPTIDRQLAHLKSLLDRAVGARIDFVVRGATGHHLDLDLRHRSAHASGGRKTEPGIVGNLPPGETYIVPYEGEVEGDPTGSRGELPVQLGDEVVVYRIEANRAVEVISRGERSDEEREHLERDPAYGNLAELGFGVLASFGIEPCGEVLLDEKLGLHIAFGRSDHFGGQVGPQDFSKPEAVVHIDRVYIPQMQPHVLAAKLTLELAEAEELVLMRDGAYAIELGED